MDTMNTFVNSLAIPEDLWEQAEILNAADTDDTHTISDPMPDAPNFAFYRKEDGAGNEDTLLIRRREDGLIDAALLVTYDHESALSPNIMDEEGAASQPSLKGFPEEEFADALKEGSSLFWNYAEFPATQKHIFATAAAWFVAGQWHHAENLENAQDFDGYPIYEKHMVRDLERMTKGFNL